MLAFVIVGLLFASLTDAYFWRNVALIIAGIATTITSLGIINSKFIAPYLAKPLAKALQREMTDMVEAIILSDPIMTQFSEQIEEVVARESTVIIQQILEMREDIRLLMARLSVVEQRQIQQHAENQKNGL